MTPFALLTIASMATQGVGSLMEGFSAASSAKIQSALNLEEAAFREKRRREIGESLKSSQRAAYGASGVDITSTAGRTPSDVIAKTARDTELDALAIRYGAENRSKILKYQGKVAKNQSIFNIGNSILGGVGSLI